MGESWKEFMERKYPYLAPKKGQVVHQSGDGGGSGGVPRFWRNQGIMRDLGIAFSQRAVYGKDGKFLGHGVIERGTSDMSEDSDIDTRTDTSPEE